MLMALTEEQKHMAEAIELFLSEPSKLDIWWCLEHNAQAVTDVEDVPDRCWWWEWLEERHEPCRMVEALVIPYED